ncbi:MAG: ABC transporter ATP-binding protein [Nanoarchaeota archaeon]
MILTKDLGKHFGGVYAVEHCSLSITPGKITSIIGPNGAGKTTLFNLISGIIRADHGTIVFDKKDITNMSIHSISQLGISRTFQQARLFKNMTIKDNLLIAHECSDTQIEDMLDSIHLQMNIHTKVAELSYGQARLVEIARARIKPHKLLMLDEPTAGVNPRIREKLKDILRMLKYRGDTIMLIEHDMEFVMSISDEVIVMSQGKVLCRGTPQQIQNNKRVLKAYLGS